MAAPRPVTDEERARVVELHAAGKSLSAIATELGRAKSTIHRVAVDAGLTWERAQTAAATAAKVVDTRARRAELEALLLQDAARLREQIWQPHEYIDHGGKEFKRVTWTQPEPSPADKLKLMQAAGLAVDRSLRIAEADAGKSVERVKSLLGGLAGALGITAPADA